MNRCRFGDVITGMVLCGTRDTADRGDINNARAPTRVSLGGRGEQGKKSSGHKIVAIQW